MGPLPTLLPSRTHRLCTCTCWLMAVVQEMPVVVPGLPRVAPSERRRLLQIASLPRQGNGQALRGLLVALVALARVPAVPDLIRVGVVLLVLVALVAVARERPMPTSM